MRGRKRMGVDRPPAEKGGPAAENGRPAARVGDHKIGGPPKMTPALHPTQSVRMLDGGARTRGGGCLMWCERELSREELKCRTAGEPEDEGDVGTARAAARCTESAAQPRGVHRAGDVGVLPFERPRRGRLIVWVVQRRDVQQGAWIARACGVCACLRSTHYCLRVFAFRTYLACVSHCARKLCTGRACGVWKVVYRSSMRCLEGGVPVEHAVFGKLCVRLGVRGARSGVRGTRACCSTPLPRTIRNVARVYKFAKRILPPQKA
eukprot:gene5785-biopygen8807